MKRDTSLLIIDYGEDYWKLHATTARYHLVHRNSKEFMIGATGMDTLRRINPVHSESSATNLEAMKEIAWSLYQHDSRYFDSTGGIFVFMFADNTIESWSPPNIE
jgi:hypothetical protein